jgi:3-keto-5-aminohexanoate cleavage enzyme
MSSYFPLPQIMVAPNGARKTTDDHPEIPVTLDRLVATASDCFDAGARAMHFHVRDEQQRHVLDAGLYREAIAELSQQLPELHLQMTTESVGRYSPEDMRKVTEEVMCEGVSIGIIEMIPDGKITNEIIRFYQMLVAEDIRVQHICYYPEHIELLSRLLTAANLPREQLWVLFTIGHYSGRISDPATIPSFVTTLEHEQIHADWGVCAFDKEEVSCLEMAISLGGHVRVGFENSMVMPDGSRAVNNRQKVELAASLFQHC